MAAIVCDIQKAVRFNILYDDDVSLLASSKQDLESDGTDGKPGCSNKASSLTLRKQLHETGTPEGILSSKVTGEALTFEFSSVWMDLFISWALFPAFVLHSGYHSTVHFIHRLSLLSSAIRKYDTQCFFFFFFWSVWLFWLNGTNFRRNVQKRTCKYDRKTGRSVEVGTILYLNKPTENSSTSYFFTLFRDTNHEFTTVTYSNIQTGNIR